MSAEEFFELFLKELEQSPHLHSYYKFLNDEKSFYFRKAYFIERLKYIQQNVTDKNAAIFDCGCGYGTTDIFLALNGHKVFGTTLEFYESALPQRIAYWSQFGNVSGFSWSYENIFDSHPAEGSIDICILQDTLHHLEPLADALAVFHKVLKPGGKLIAVEENGSNIIQSAKLYKQRGNNRIIDMYDEKLGKTILLGNENIRSLGEWTKAFAAKGFSIGNVEYVRLFWPFQFNKENYDKRVAQEKSIYKKNSLLRNYFYFGLNFVATRN
jgi:SAM-dependent methyltransferase